MYVYGIRRNVGIGTGIGLIAWSSANDTPKHLVQIIRLQCCRGSFRRGRTTGFHINHVACMTSWCAIGSHVGLVLFAFSNHRPKGTQFLTIQTGHLNVIGQPCHVFTLHVVQGRLDTRQGGYFFTSFGFLHFPKDLGGFHQVHVLVFAGGFGRLGLGFLSFGTCITRRGTMRVHVCGILVTFSHFSPDGTFIVLVSTQSIFFFFLVVVVTAITDTTRIGTIFVHIVRIGLTFSQFCPNRTTFNLIFTGRFVVFVTFFVVRLRHFSSTMLGNAGTAGTRTRTMFPHVRGTSFTFSLFGPNGTTFMGITSPGTGIAFLGGRSVTQNEDQDDDNPDCGAC
mmetsp:Transcript_9530/g.18325  ORF Transcript_9530/g.18325 Transcript_9530/m.18325 type:complete len:337 (+) Transcript_9530:2390-3400(+)